MRFPAPPVFGRLIRRYKRFLAEVELAGGEIVTAHCPNSGSMLGLSDPGLPVGLLPTGAGPGRLPYRWVLVELPSGPVGIDTHLPNRLAAEAIAAGAIPELAGYPAIRREVRYGANSRVDLLLEADGRPPCYVEVKNVHLRRPDGPHPEAAEFPDSVTARGLKHLAELSAVAAAGARAVMLFIVQRNDCAHFRIAADIDRAYQTGLDAALRSGVEALCYACRVGRTGIAVDRPLPTAFRSARSPSASDCRDS
jgi:sugar fermentation stimulation protein A